MTTSAESKFPKLRDLDVHQIIHNGNPAILLRDPLRLTDKTVIIPQVLVPLLMLCDGTLDVKALHAALLIRFGLNLGVNNLEQMIATLDGALLLDNAHFSQAKAQALEEYHQAPFRPLSMAGKSYPADASELRRLLDGYMADTNDVTDDGAAGRGLVSPHIDYARGGAVYAQVWRHAAEMVKVADLVILLGTDHTGGAGRLTLTRQNYATPFGVLPTAREIVDALAQAIGDDAAYEEELHHLSEHSIELAAVWLHYIRAGEPCEIVPILCGSFDHLIHEGIEPEDDAAIGALVDTLNRETVGRRTLVVAAGDLSHVGPAFGGQPLDMWGRARLKKADEEIMARVCAGDAAGFFAAIKRAGDRHNVCGLPPIYLALRMLSPVAGKQVAYDLCPADGNNTSWVSVCGILFG